MSAVALGSLGVDLVFSACTRYARYQEASVQSTTQEFLSRNARRTRAKADRPLAKPKGCLLSESKSRTTVGTRRAPARLASLALSHCAFASHRAAPRAPLGQRVLFFFMSDEEDDDELYYVDTLQIEIDQVSNDLADERDAYNFAQGALKEAERWVALVSEMLKHAEDDYYGYALDFDSLLSSSEVGMNSADYLRDKEDDVATHFQNTTRLEKRFSELCQWLEEAKAAGRWACPDDDEDEDCEEECDDGEEYGQ